MKSNRPTGIFLLIIPLVIFLIYIYLLFASSLDLLYNKTYHCRNCRNNCFSIYMDWIYYDILLHNTNEITDDNI